MFVLLETGMPLQSNDEVFICDEDLVIWDDAIDHYGNVMYNEESMMPVRRKISGAFEPAQQHLTGKLFNGPCAKNVIIYCQEFDPANKNCQSCDVRPTA